MTTDEKPCRWIIISDGWDCHYVRELCSWKDAILNHIEWCNGKDEDDLYPRALQGFDNMEDSIKLYNTMFDGSVIIGMFPVGYNSYIDETYM